MIKRGETVFVDTGAWIALASSLDPLHSRALTAWDEIAAAGAKVRTSVAVVLETYTFLDRRWSREAAEAWRRSLTDTPRFSVLPVTPADLESAWPWLARREFTRVGIVDATSFVLMKREKIRVAFAFDVHFSQAGFVCLG